MSTQMKKTQDNGSYCFINDGKQEEPEEKLALKKITRSCGLLIAQDNQLRQKMR